MQGVHHPGNVPDWVIGFKQGMSPEDAGVALQVLEDLYPCRPQARNFACCSVRSYFVFIGEFGIDWHLQSAPAKKNHRLTKDPVPACLSLRLPLPGPRRTVR